MKKKISSLFLALALVVSVFALKTGDVAKACNISDTTISTNATDDPDPWGKSIIIIVPLGTDDPDPWG